MTPHEDLLCRLAGHSQDKPLRLDHLADDLGLAPGALAEVAEDLRDARAICLATLTKGGETYAVAWPTGLPPKPLSARSFTLGTQTQADARIARDKALAEAAKPKTKTKTEPAPPLTPSPSPASGRGEQTQEPPMPRIPAPAQPREPHPHPHNKGRSIPQPPRPAPMLDALHGVVQAAGGEVTSQDVFDALPSEYATTKDSVDTGLRKLMNQGRIQSRKVYLNSRTRLVFWTDEAPAPAQGRADKRSASAATAAPQPEAAPAAPDTRAAQKLGLETPTPRYALWDDGSLVISAGDEMLCLPRADAHRLRAFLTHTGV